MSAAPALVVDRRQALIGGAAMAALPIPADRLAAALNEPVIGAIGECHRIAAAWAGDARLMDDPADRQPVWEGYAAQFEAAESVVYQAPLRGPAGVAAALRYGFGELLGGDRDDLGDDERFQRRALLRALDLLEGRA